MKISYSSFKLFISGILLPADTEALLTLDGEGSVSLREADMEKMPPNPNEKNQLLLLKVTEFAAFVTAVQSSLSQLIQ